jgi:hypothetical protein
MVPYLHDNCWLHLHGKWTCLYNQHDVNKTAVFATTWGDSGSQVYDRSSDASGKLVQRLSYGLDCSGLSPGKSKKCFSSIKCPDRLWNSHSLLLNGYRRSVTVVKRPRRGDVHSPPSSAEIKNIWSYTCTAPTCLQARQWQIYY